MIKLNRIGNKLGLAGALGVLLAIGMVANQMMTEIADRRLPTSAPPARRRWPTTRWRRISTCARSSSPPAISGWRRTPGRRRKDRRRPAALQGEPWQRNIEAALATAQKRGHPGTAAEDQGPDGQASRPPWKISRKRRSRCWRRSTSARPSRMNGPRPSRPSWVRRRMAKLDNRARHRTSAVSGRCQGERAAGGGLEARRHRRCQPGHRDGQDRGLAEGRLQQAARRGRRPRIAGRGQ